MFLDPAPQLPKQIILELGKHFSEFQEQADKGEFLGFDLEVQLSEILQELSIKKDAEHNLNVTHHTYISDCADTELAGEVMEFVEARKKFCDFLLKELEIFRLYFNGYLFYTYGRLIGTKLVLEKISVAIEEHDRLARTITNQANFAIKRFIENAATKTEEPPNS
jgi:hypothetical protein